MYGEFDSSVWSSSCDHLDTSFCLRQTLQVTILLIRRARSPENAESTSFSYLWFCRRSAFGGWCTDTIENFHFSHFDHLNFCDTMSSADKPKVNPILHFVAGGVGGTIGAVLTCPLEVVKTRLQSTMYQKGVARGLGGMLRYVYK